MLSEETQSKLFETLGDFPVSRVDGGALSVSAHVLALLNPDAHAETHVLPSNVRAFPLAMGASVDSVYSAALAGEL